MVAHENCESSHHGRALLSPYDFEDPAFRRAGRLPNLRYGDQVRAIWVTRYDFRSEADIIRIMERSAQLGFNTVFFQVRGNGTTYYRSNLEPWSETYHWRSPGYDPLLVAVQEAHGHNMSLHAWVNVMPMWRGPMPPPNKEHIYWTHPEWSWYNRKGERQPLNRGFYVSLNPCLPEARKHIVRICREIVSSYEIDGLHLDYIRFPNERPVENGEEYPQDQKTLELFKSETGFRVDDRPHLWDRWRSDCVTTLVRDIRRTIKSVRPQIVLTAAVGSERLAALSHFQDVELWWKERLLDAVVPMNYTGCQKTFRRRIEYEWLVKTNKRFFSSLNTLFFGQEESVVTEAGRGGQSQITSDKSVVEWSRPPEPAIVMGTSAEFGDGRLHQKQLTLALQRFGHFSVFSYASVFGEGRSEARLTPLHSFLRILADASKVCPTAGYKLETTNSHPEEAGSCRHLFDLLQVSSTDLEVAKVVETSQVAIERWRSRQKLKQLASMQRPHPTKVYRRTFRRKGQKRRRSNEELKDNFYRHNLPESEIITQSEQWEAMVMSEATVEEEGDEEETQTAQYFLLHGLVGNVQDRDMLKGGTSGTIRRTTPLCTISALHGKVVVPNGFSVQDTLMTKVRFVIENAGRLVGGNLRKQL